MKISSTLAAYIRNPAKIINYLGSRCWMKFLPDKLYLTIVYRATMGKKLNLDDPKTFTEKIQWLKLYDRKPEYIQLVDKYKVRKYIEKTIGKKYLVPLLGVYRSFHDIDFNRLPNQFVLKCTHDSGSIILCKNKAKFNIEDAKKKLTKCLKLNYYYTGREWPYKYVKPRIICEKYLQDGVNVVPKDFKVYCFHGEPKYIFVLHDKFKEGVKKSGTVYTTDWKVIPCVFDSHYRLNEVKAEKPKCLDELLNLSKTLCRGFYQVRIDFYIVNNKIYFSEITLSTSSGLVPIIPESYDLLLGSFVKLPTDVKGGTGK